MPSEGTYCRWIPQRSLTVTGLISTVRGLNITVTRLISNVTVGLLLLVLSQLCVQCLCSITVKKIKDKVYQNSVILKLSRPTTAYGTRLVG